MSDRIGDWIQTHTGRKFHPLDPRPDEVCIEDIAHALSNVCRFAGHSKEFYSVAQHCTIVAGACPKEARLWGLLHDASEAYIGDMTRPLKRSLILSGVTFYKDVERQIMDAVADHFNISREEPTIVSDMDARVLLTERRDLFHNRIDWEGWTGRKDLIEFDFTITPIGPRKAKAEFLEAFKMYS